MSLLSWFQRAPSVTESLSVTLMMLCVNNAKALVLTRKSSGLLPCPATAPGSGLAASAARPGIGVRG